METESNKMKYLDEKAKLTPMEYRVTQEKATERPFSNKYNRHWEAGTYHCIICNTELFPSTCKFESKSGWPAFSNIVDPQRVKLTPDASHVGANLLLLVTRPDLVRTEVSCAQCGSHLGHLFKDGPPPTNLRYCINSSSLNFLPSQDENQKKTEGTAEKVCSTPGKICFFSSQPPTTVPQKALAPRGVNSLFSNPKDRRKNSQETVSAPPSIILLRETAL